MKRIATAALLLPLISAIAFAQWQQPKTIRSKLGGTNGNLVVWDSTERYVVDNGLSGAGVGSALSRTSVWDQAAIESAWASNAIVAGSSTWYKAALDAIIATNWIYTNTLGARITVLEAGTSTWYKAAEDAIFATNVLHQNTNAWTLAANRAYVEQCIDGAKSQTFTAAAGFEIITNFVTILPRGSWTTSHSNVIVGTTGDYSITLTTSYNSSAVNLLTEGHLFTNETQVSRIGWSRSFGAAAPQGSAAGSGLIRLTAGTHVTLRLDTDKTTTTTFDHLSMMLNQLKE